MLRQVVGKWLRTFPRITVPSTLRSKSTGRLSIHIQNVNKSNVLVVDCKFNLALCKRKTENRKDGNILRKIVNKNVR